MKIVPASAILIDNPDIFQQVEAVGRTCYKSEDKITSDSAEKFVHNMIERHHVAMLEHGRFHLMCHQDIQELHDIPYLTHGLYQLKNNVGEMDTWYVFNLSLRHIFDTDGISKMFHPNLIDVLIQTMNNARADVNKVSSFMWDGQRVALFFDVRERVKALHNMYTSETNNSELFRLYFECHDITVKFTCDRGVSHEIVRHRNSFGQESTRYCNYAKEKFGKEITVIRPCFLTEDTPQWAAWESAMHNSEFSYFQMLDRGCTPQEARSVLPNSLKTEVCMTCSRKDSEHFINLRSRGTTGAPHPQMKEVADIFAQLIETEDEIVRLSFVNHKFPDSPLQLKAELAEGSTTNYTVDYEEGSYLYLKEVSDFGPLRCNLETGCIEVFKSDFQWCVYLGSDMISKLYVVRKNEIK